MPPRVFRGLLLTEVQIKAELFNKVFQSFDNSFHSLDFPGLNCYLSQRIMSTSVVSNMLFHVKDLLKPFHCA